MQDKVKIVVLEDDPAIRIAVRDILKEQSYAVYTAEDGEQGLELIREVKPDIIVCDIMMPRLSGFDVLKTLSREQELQHAPFIFLTAKAEMSDLREGMSLGADDYLTKPFRAAELLKAIEMRLKRRNSNTQNLELGNEVNGKKEKRNRSADDSIVITVNKAPMFIKLKDIVCINGLSEYSQILTVQKEKLTVRKLLREWERLLPDKTFVRIHKSTIININYIEKIEPWFKRSFKVYLKGIDETYIISQRYYSKLKASDVF